MGNDGRGPWPGGESDFTALVENLGVPVFCVDDRGGLVYANREAGRLIPSGVSGNGPSISDVLTNIPPDGWKARWHRACSLGSYSEPCVVAGEVGNLLPVTATFRRVALSTGPVLVVTVADISCLRDVEEELEQTQDKFFQLYEQMRDGFMALDLGRHILDTNQAFRDMLGYSGPELSRMTCMDITPSGCRTEDEKLYRDEVLARGYSRVYEKQYRCKDGSLVPVEVRMSLIRDHDGQPAGVWVVARDITERKRNREVLENQKLFLETLLDSLPLLLFYKDMDGRYLGCNRAFAEHLGVPQDQVRGMSVHDVAPREEAVSHSAADDSLLGGEGGELYEIKGVGANGVVRDFIITKAVFHDAGGNPAGIVGVAQDVTERNRAFEALRDSEERFRTLVENMQEGLMILDPDGRFTFVNSRLSLMLGQGRSDMVGRRMDEYLDEANRAVFRREVGRRREGYAEPYELAWLHASGRLVHSQVSPAPLFDDDGKFVGSFGIITDLTRFKNLETQLVQAQRLEAIGQLAAGIAHEINTPTQYVDNNIRYLKGVCGDFAPVMAAYADVLAALDRGEGVEEASARARELAGSVDIEGVMAEIPEALDDSLEGLSRIAEIVRSVRQLSHPGQGQMEPSDLNEAVRGTVTVSTNEWKYCAELETDLDENLPFVPCLLAEFNQVLLNLIVNAAQAIKGRYGEQPRTKGLIRVSTRRDGGWAVVRVQDDGVGVPEKDLARIFDPFFTTKEVGKGTGQGLAICHRVVDKHGGTIDCESTPGRGAAFVIRLPLSEEGGA